MSRSILLLKLKPLSIINYQLSIIKMTQTPPRPKIENKEIQDNLTPNNGKNVKLNDISVQTNTFKKNESTLVSKFYNLSIRGKLFTVFFLAQGLTIAGLLGFGALTTIKTSQEQLARQSESELAATEINYGIKVNQMGFGFRGQSDNISIKQAAFLASQGETLPPQLKQQVKNVLQNEISARKIEYATLVGRNRKIIVGANNDRTGEIFDPEGLVSKVITNPEQIKSSAIVSYEELKQESPPIFPNLKEQEEFLIRYTATPVKDSSGSRVLGVLISGDVVDGKYSIAENTTTEFKGGYAGIYKFNEDREEDQDKLILASSVAENGENKDQDLSDNTKKILLDLLLKNPEKLANARGVVDKKSYTFTAGTILNENKNIVGLLVRGTPETDLIITLRASLFAQGVTGFVIVLFNLLLVFSLSNIIAKRLEDLESVSGEFAQGNLTRRVKVIGKDEIGNLALSFNLMAETLAQKEDALVQEARQVVFLQEITGARTIDEEDINKVFDKSLKKARRILQVDRIVVYRFYPDWSGFISHEAGDRAFSSALTEKIEDPCIPENLRVGYLNGRIVATEDVFNAGFHPEHEALMTRLQIRANLVVPILNQGRLFGLLIAHDCQKTRLWKENEKSFLNQMAIRFGVILDRVSLFQVQINTAKRADQLKEITLFIASGLSRQNLLDLAVTEIREAIESDRVIVYEFDENWKGTIIAESVLEKYPKALGAEIADPCFADKYVSEYEKGRVQGTPDIYNAGLTPCHLRQLEPFQVKANLVAPILVDRKLIGLLIAHQCSGVRNWEQGVIELFSQLATQIGLGIERVNLLEEQRRSEREQREGKENLQRRALELLMEVDPITQGDLTIRAQVTEDEIGTIADSYNATIQSLRKIVSQVKTAAIEVAKTTNTNESDVNMLREEVQEQVENIAVVVEQIELMNKSSSMVAESAEQAEQALQKAQENVDKGDVAMNKTVQSILQIRSTVQEAASEVKRLGEASKKISNVVNLIGGFAAQTHLLALKASIEAARAGEQGLGFAVIANEVRTLATQSAEATSDIEKLVMEIQSETNSVMLAMEDSTEQVAEGTKLVEETRQSLNQITAATIQINELVEGIAAAAFEQTENSAEVTIKMANVADVSEKTTISVTKLSNSFQQLLEVAQQLESNVAKFTV